MNAPRTRVQRRPVHGLLLLDKPYGLSSNDALQKVKWLLRAEKAGHTGTLDPLATGVLPLCFGAATKFSQLHLDADKAYEAVIRLGQTTRTGDAEGEVISEQPVSFTAAQLAEVQTRFTGPQRQLPPMHSALKKDGKALYTYAREGLEVAREARDIQVYSLQLRDMGLQDGVHSLHMRASVSKGTYIRTLGEDIGAALGCGGHLSLLRRERTGNFDLSQCIGLQDLEDSSEQARWAALQPVDHLLQGHSVVELDTEDAGRFLSGQRRRGLWADDPQVAVYGRSPRALLGTARVFAGELIPGRLLSPLEIQQILQGPALPLPTLPLPIEATS